MALKLVVIQNFSAGGVDFHVGEVVDGEKLDAVLAKDFGIQNFTVDRVESGFLKYTDEAGAKTLAGQHESHEAKIARAKVESDARANQQRATAEETLKLARETTERSAREAAAADKAVKDAQSKAKDVEAAKAPKTGK